MQTQDKIQIRFFDPRPGHKMNQGIIDDVSGWPTDEIKLIKQINATQGRTEHEFKLIAKKED